MEPHNQLNLPISDSDSTTWDLYFIQNPPTPSAVSAAFLVDVAVGGGVVVVVAVVVVVGLDVADVVVVVVGVAAFLDDSAN